MLKKNKKKVVLFNIFDIIFFFQSLKEFTKNISSPLFLEQFTSGFLLNVHFNTTKLEGTKFLNIVIYE